MIRDGRIKRYVGYIKMKTGRIQCSLGLLNGWSVAVVAGATVITDSQSHSRVASPYNYESCKRSNQSREIIRKIHCQIAEAPKR